MSLLDMMNFSLHGFVWALRLLSQEIYTATQRNAQDHISNEDKIRIESNIRFVAEQCDRLSLSNTHNRQERVYLALRRLIPCTYAQIMLGLNTLHEAIEDDIITEYFYHYPRNKALLLIANSEWIQIFKAFPSAKSEIEEGIDCYAMEHNTACVFHMMRAAEVGLRAIARERRVKTVRSKTPVEWGTWNDVLRAVEQQLGRIRNATAGPKKDAALAFYNGAMSDLRALQDLYRDRTMHLRESYDEGQAQSAMHRVRSLLDNLASRLNEATIRQIRWGI
jgi:hypothetical protein